MHISDLKTDYKEATDVRFAGPIHECPICESNLWNVKCTFAEYTIAMYYLDMECAICGTKAIAPTPIDDPEYVPEG
jgi:hypothetical protein